MRNNLKRKDASPSSDPTLDDSPSVQFTEDMHGYVAIASDALSSFGKDDAKAFEQAKSQGMKAHRTLKFHLTISIEHIERFINDPNLSADAFGYVECSELGGRFEVEKGRFNLFTRPTSSPDFDAAKEMHYHLLFRDQNGSPWTFYGYKVVERQTPEELWSQTTTLYTRLWQGEFMDTQSPQPPWAQGILTLNMADFAKQMTTLRSNGKTLAARTKAIALFMDEFAANLWQAYAPSVFDTESSRWNEHIYPLGTTQGVKDAKVSHHPFQTEDGLSLSLSRFQRKASKDVVLLLHGLTTSTDMFIMPEHYNLTSYLLDQGYTDVFSLDWRGSNRFVYNLKVHRYTMDDVALYDVPKALEVMRAMLPAGTRIHVIAHCVGSITFMSSLSAGLIDGVSSVISNSVSLTPQIRWQSRIKLKFAPWIVDHVFRYPYISPEMSYLPGWRSVKLLALMEHAIRRECKEPACHMVSFMWGWGFPAAYEHKNLHPLTHRRLKDLFGGTSMNYFRHMNKMVSEAESVPYDRQGIYEQLPSSYLKNMTQIKVPPILFVSGDHNLIFPDSNKRTFESLKAADANMPIEFQSFPGYGHQDVFMGKDCHRDIFPSLIKFLNKQKGAN